VTNEAFARIKIDQLLKDTDHAGARLECRHAHRQPDEEGHGVDGKREQQHEHRAEADHRPRARAPGGAGVLLEVLGRAVPEELAGVAALDEREALGEEAFQLDGADLGAVLLALGALLVRFVVVELAADAVDAAMEEVHQRPEKVGQVGLEARLAEAGDECVEDVGDGAGEAVGSGERPRVGFVGEGTVAVELELVEQVRGGGGGLGGVGVVEAVGHGRVLAVTGRAHRGLRGDHPAEGGTDRHPQAKPEGRNAAEDGGAWLSCLAIKRPVRGAGKKASRRRCGEARLRPNRSLESYERGRRAGGTDRTRPICARGLAINRVTMR